MGDQEDGPVEGVHGLLQLLDGRQVEVIRGFVQNEQVDAARLQQGQGSRVRSPGDSEFAWRAT